MEQSSLRIKEFAPIEAVHSFHRHCALLIIFTILQKIILPRCDYAEKAIEIYELSNTEIKKYFISKYVSAPNDALDIQYEPRRFGSMKTHLEKLNLLIH
jgi:hypothetical protein